MIFHWYGFLIGLGILCAFELVRRQAIRFQIPPSIMESCVVWMIIPAVVGARIYHVLTDWPLYQQSSWFELIALWNGGLGFYGALLGGLLGLLLFVSLKGNKSDLKQFSKTTQLLLLADLFAFGLPFGQLIGRFGNFINTEIYGLPTNLPWALTVKGERFHPLFAYEQVCLFLLAISLLWISSKKRLVLGKGQYFAIYLVAYGISRFWLEFLRLETARFSGIFALFSIAQWVSIGLMSGGILLFWVRRHALKKKGAMEWDFSLQ